LINEPFFSKNNQYNQNLQKLGFALGTVGKSLMSFWVGGGEAGPVGDFFLHSTFGTMENSFKQTVSTF
jgi:hypothetical protein